MIFRRKQCQCWEIILIEFSSLSAGGTVTANQYVYRYWKMIHTVGALVSIVRLGCELCVTGFLVNRFYNQFILNCVETVSTG